jgi:hypothetical protein
LYARFTGFAMSHILPCNFVKGGAPVPPHG